MNKTIERIEAYKRNTLQHAIDKAKEDYHEAELNYRDTGYDRYWNKMQKLQQDIEELEAYQEREQAISIAADQSVKLKAEVDEIKKELKTKVEYVLAAIRYSKGYIVKLTRRYIRNLKILKLKSEGGIL